MQVASTKELQRVSDLVRSSLGLKQEKLHNQETRQKENKLADIKFEEKRLSQETTILN